MARATRLSFPVFSYRRLETPFDKESGYRNSIAVVEVSALPDLANWREINVRDPKLSGQLPREIRESFLGNLETFLFLSRGLVLAVKAVEFDNKEGMLTLVLDNPKLHGLLDGGHNYEIIRRNRGAISEKGQKQYVKIEFIEGFDAESLVDLVDARNSSKQVRDESLMNLADEFGPIREVLKDQPYFDKIAFSEFELGSDGDPKPISIREIVSLLMTMDRDNFDASIHPINAYRSKSACLKHFEVNKAAFKKLYPLTPEILRLWDSIHLCLPDLYNNARKQSGVTGGRFGSLTGVTSLKNEGIELEFTGKNSMYLIPTGLKYPVLGAFRALLEVKRDRYVWGKRINPIDLLEGDLGTVLARTIGEFALEAKNPSKTGKSQLVWQSCYQSAELTYLRMQ